MSERPGSTRLRGAGGAPRAEHTAAAKPARVAALRWAPRIEPRRLRRLYLREARGAAVGVGDTRFHGDPVADPERGYLVAHLQHGAGGLMAKHHRLPYHERSDAAVPVVVDVAAADAHGVDRHAHVARSEPLGYRKFAQRKLFGALQDQRLHRSSPAPISGQRRRGARFTMRRSPRR